MWRTQGLYSVIDVSSYTIAIDRKEITNTIQIDRAAPFQNSIPQIDALMATTSIYMLITFGQLPNYGVI